VAERSIVELSDRVVEAVNAARAAKADESLIAELEVTLKEYDETSERLGTLVEVVPELQMLTTSNNELAQSRQLIAVLRTAADTDAIGAARSEDGRALTVALRNGVSELSEDATEAWDALRVALRADVRTDFLRKLTVLPGFAVASSLLSDNYIVQDAVSSSRLPDAAKIRDVQAARERLDRGLEELQSLLPEAIRRPLDDCFRGELRLVDVTDEFLKWIRDKDLEDAFKVEVS
jgi:hypothetical protein